MHRYYPITLLVLMLCVSSEVVYAQNHNEIDSLKGVLLQDTLLDYTKAKVLNRLGNKLKKKNPQEGLKYIRQALELAQKTSNKYEEAYAFFIISSIIDEYGQYSKSIAYQLKALETFLDFHDTTQLFKVYSGIGINYIALKNYPQAKEYLTKAYNLGLARNYNHLLLPAHVNLAACLQEAGNDDEAYKLLQQGAKILTEMPPVQKAKLSYNLQEGSVLLQNNIGEVLRHMKRYDEALQVFHATMPQLLKLKQPLEISKLYVSLAELSLDKQWYDSCIYWSGRALSVSLQNNYLSQSCEVYKYLSLASAARGHYKEAFTYFNQHAALKDSLFNEDEFAKVQQLQESYDLGLKEQELNVIKAENERNALRLMVTKISLTAAVIIIVLIVYILLQKNRLIKKLNNSNKEIKRLNNVLEIKALRSKMDPHFVFNALNGVQHFIASSNPESAMAYLGKTALLIRHTLQNVNKDWVMLIEEITLIELYLKIESYRFPNKFNYNISVEPGIEKAKIPFLVIQPYVENAILHGLMNREDGMILITAYRHNASSIYVVIEDNGAGRKKTKDSASQKTFDSMGSGLVHERLKMLSDMLGETLSVITDDLVDENNNPKGTRVLISLAA